MPQQVLEALDLSLETGKLGSALTGHLTTQKLNRKHVEDLLSRVRGFTSFEQELGRC